MAIEQLTQVSQSDQQPVLESPTMVAKTQLAPAPERRVRLPEKVLSWFMGVLEGTEIPNQYHYR